MTYKHKTHAVDSDGKITSNADVDFYIDEVSLPAFFLNFPFLIEIILIANAVWECEPYCHVCPF